MVTIDLVLDALMLVFSITAVVCMVCSVIVWRVYGEDSARFQRIYGTCCGMMYAAFSVSVVIPSILFVWTP